MNLTLGRARRADVFCSSLRICLNLVAIAVKYRCFCRPDGISITLLEEDVYCKENFICSLLFATKVHDKFVYHRRRSFLYLLLLYSFVFMFMCGDVEKCPGPAESNIQDLFNQKRLEIFHQNILGLFIILLNYPFFYTLTRIHVYFLSVKRISIIQHQHNILKFQGTPSLTNIEMLALTVALLFLLRMAYHLLEGLIWKLMNWDVFDLK